ncbi:uncharacterized protein LOC118566734 [Fundulus heteroclitus]|uniref:uncharacterized protein LOC118566734 n=1 Tax=Fundulus heteroclitus TaxID=8078 RepID=UPI00165BEA2C|nr:uncharacterized protein LOC118566734 [Fundulus heteroclitus]
MLGRKPLIIGGDFNCVLTRKDRKRIGQIYKVDKTSLLLQRIVRDFKLVDCFKTMHPREEGFTWVSDDSSKASRIDYFFIRDCTLTDARLSPVFFSDHLLLSCTLSLPSGATTGRGLWKLNRSLLEDQALVSQYRERYQEWQTLQDLYETRAQWWEMVKGRTQTFFRQAGKNKKKKEQSRMMGLQKRLQRYYFLNQQGMNECYNLHCKNCKSNEHLTKDCAHPMKCNLCGEEQHTFRTCSKSYANRIRAPQQQEERQTTVENTPQSAAENAGYNVNDPQLETANEQEQENLEGGTFTLLPVFTSPDPEITPTEEPTTETLEGATAQMDWSEQPFTDLDLPEDNRQLRRPTSEDSSADETVASSSGKKSPRVVTAIACRNMLDLMLTNITTDQQGLRMTQDTEELSTSLSPPGEEGGGCMESFPPAGCLGQTSFT